MKKVNFITEIIDQHIKEDRFSGRVHTRFPPEPNGYLHIGHAKAICLNFGIAKEYKGKCNLRFDDTNPITEQQDFVDSIINDIEWLGFQTKGNIYYASDYFSKMYDYAIILINKGLAYVDDQSAEQIRETRGTLTVPGTDSPFRDRTVEENINLFTQMKDGKFSNGEKVLRARIDMKSSNLNMRDPVMYRILHASHHHTKDDWCIYPMYDWAHGIEDSIENITNSLCSLEFQDHRPLYDWFLKNIGVYRPQQTEFARLNLSYTIMSKRKLAILVNDGHVNGWDDPRMPTISGLKRRGYSPESIRMFCDEIGIAKRDGISDIALLEHCLRSDLNKRAQRVMAVLDPIKLIIENYPEAETEIIIADNNPENENDGTREIPFSRELWIERSDFMEEPFKKYFRLSIGKEVRLKHAYYVTCTGFAKDKDGKIHTVRCNYDPDSKGGWTNDGRKVRGTIHWVSSKHAIKAEIRLFNHLFISENPEIVEISKSFTDNLNPDSLKIVSECMLEPSLQKARVGEYYQFIRSGYFALDSESKSSGLIFNRTVTLRDTYNKK